MISDAAAVTPDEMPVHALRKWLLGCSALLLLTYVVGIFTMGIDADELQALVTSDSMARGEQLYTQVWDNHGPLMAYMLSGYVKLFKPADHAVLIHLRLIMFAVQMGTLLMFYLWMRRINKPGSLAPELAVLLLVQTYFFARKGFEIRNDNPMHFFWMATLLLWFVAWKADRLILYFVAGLTLGICFLFSFKTLMLGSGVFLMFLMAMWRGRRLLLLQMVLFGLGTAIAPILMVLALKAEGNFDAFWTSYVGQNVDRYHQTLSRAFEVFSKCSPLWIWAFIFSLLYIPRKIWLQSVSDEIAILWPCAALLLFQFLFLLPTHFNQSVLPITGPANALIAWTIVDFGAHLPFSRLGWLRRIGRFRLAVIAVLVSTGAAVEAQEFYSINAPEQLRHYNQLLDQIEPESMVFDGYGVPFFRPRPSYPKAIVQTLIDRYKDGKFKISFTGDLNEKDVPYIVYDRRVADLGTEVRVFIEKNYLPMRLQKLMAAGKVVGKQDVPSFEIKIAGKYHWKLTEGENLIIDGTPAAHPIALADGQHQVDWQGEGTLVLCTMPPERWGNWKIMGKQKMPKKKDYWERLYLFWPKQENYQ